MPTGIYERAKRDPIERFKEKFTILQNGCWEWTASKTTYGYGQIHTSRGRATLAHIFAYKNFVGEIPDGLELDHLCRNRACVNPAHLEPVTHAENIRRGDAPKALARAQENIRKEREFVCKYGHRLTSKTAYFDRDGVKTCKFCNALKQKRHRAKKRKEENAKV